jgi:hypothetical protein
MGCFFSSKLEQFSKSEPVWQQQIHSRCRPPPRVRLAAAAARVSPWPGKLGGEGFSGRKSLWPGLLRWPRKVACWKSGRNAVCFAGGLRFYHRQVLSLIKSSVLLLVLWCFIVRWKCFSVDKTRFIIKLVGFIAQVAIKQTISFSIDKTHSFIICNPWFYNLHEVFY